MIIICTITCIINALITVYYERIIQIQPKIPNVYSCIPNMLINKVKRSPLLNMFITYDTPVLQK